MAGIAGIVGRDRADNVRRMIETINHRGPDTVRNHHTDALAAAVCASRLSPARGDGFAADAGLAVLFDGEVYNDRPDGESDAQVALGLYRRHGRAFAGHLEGVFACAVVDGDEVVLARDAVGVRPMYVGTDGDAGGAAFCSEMKGLVGVSEDVWELPPATTWSTATGLAGFLPYYPPVHVPTGVDEAIARVREVLLAAVERRIADGAIGACLLSGGLDSSIIACAAHHLGLRDVPLVTVGVEGAPDLANAEIVAEQLGMEHKVHLFTPEEIEHSVPRAVRVMESFDEDCVSGTIANLFASALADESTNCILSGEGGDELFGGYHLLKELPTEAQRLNMMHRLIEVAHNTAVQRLDRAMMANAINYRTPFIDTEVVALALQLPVRWKIHPTADGRQVEKWIIREAFRDLLPDAIYRRDKLRFSGGTGTDGLMDRLAEDKVAAGEFEELRLTEAGYRLNSPKELWYYRLFREAFPAACFERLVGRWDPGK
jgi:asparagine synthase (glutamine-hydrolysing)